MLTPPSDLPESALHIALTQGWSLRAATLEYRPVGFGSHHWEATDTAGGRWFVTVDDLRTAAGYDCLRAALSAAQALRAAGRDFVVAPVPARDGGPLVRMGDIFAVAVYPFMSGVENRNGAATLDLVIAVHAAPPEIRDLACPDDYAIPSRDAFDGGGRTRGPFARPAAELLAAHAAALQRSLARFDALVAQVRARPPRMVLTHGEPHPGNVMDTGDGWLLVDWDTARVAPPERDVMHLSRLGDAYNAATGTALRPDILDLYRLRWHLTEIALGLAYFARPHGATADDEETWANLRDSMAQLG